MHNDTDTFTLRSLGQMLDIDSEETVWMDDAACAGYPKPDEFHVDVPGSRPTKAARRRCAICPVAGPCLEYAIKNNLSGLWGGTTKKQRDDMVYQRRRAVA